MGATIQEIAKQIPTLQEEFNDFIKTQDFWTKTDRSLQLLLPRERALLTRIFEITEDQLPFFFAEKLKERAALVWKETFMWKFAYEDLFSAKYTTNFDLEFDALSKGDENIQLEKSFLVRSRDLKSFQNTYSHRQIGGITFRVAQYPFPWIQNLQRELSELLSQEVTNHKYTEKFSKVPWLLNYSNLSWPESLIEALTTTVGYHFLWKNPSLSIDSSSYHGRRKFLTNKVHEDLNKILKWFIDVHVEHESEDDDENETMRERNTLIYKIDIPDVLHTNENISLI